MLRWYWVQTVASSFPEPDLTHYADLKKEEWGEEKRREDIRTGATGEGQNVGRQG